MELRMLFKVLFIIQILQDLLQCRVYSSGCPDPNQYPMKSSGRCCRKCKAGEKVKQHCQAGKPNSTQCQDCEERGYQPKPNGEEQCYTCDPQAKSNIIIILNCTKTHDIKYGRCVKGFFKNEDLDDCMACKSCRKGFGVKEECKKNSNTQCMEVKCGVGTFSDKESLTQRCRPCTPCNGDEEMLKSCSAISNYICRKIRIGRNQSTPMSILVTDVTPRFESEPTSANSSSNTGWVMPFFVSSMVLLIALFFGFVIGVSLWCHRHSTRQSSIVGERPAAKRHDETPSVFFPRKDGSHLVLVKEVCDNGVLIRNVSHDIIEKLASCLNPTNHPANWRKVASSLGFKWGSINNLALVPRSATQDMLQRWGTKKNSTVFKLYKVLKYIERDDAAELLENILVEPPAIQCSWPV